MFCSQATNPGLTYVEPTSEDESDLTQVEPYVSHRYTMVSNIGYT